MRRCRRGTREEVPEIAHKAELTEQTVEWCLPGAGGGERNGERMVKGHRPAAVRGIRPGDPKYSMVIIVRYLYVVYFIYC